MDVSFLRAQREYELSWIEEDDQIPFIDEMRLKRVENIKKLEKADLYVMSKSDAVFVVSTYERDMLNKRFRGRKRIDIVSNIYPEVELSTMSFEDYSKLNSVLFVGNMCHPRE